MNPTRERKVKHNGHPCRQRGKTAIITKQVVITRRIATTDGKKDGHGTEFRKQYVIIRKIQYEIISALRTGAYFGRGLSCVSLQIDGDCGAVLDLLQASLQLDVEDHTVPIARVFVLTDDVD